MMTAFRGWSLGCVISGALLTSLPVHAQDSEGVVRLGGRTNSGVVRISDQTQSVQQVRGQSVDESAFDDESEIAPTTHCEVDDAGVDERPRYPVGYSPEVVPGCHPETGLRWKMAAWIHNDLARKGTWFNNKREKHGPGRPLGGSYNMVYPVDPGYFDQRDGQVYAAPGYGGPVSVPLAPVVNSSYNYGWGIPSSRLTPVLHPATQAPVSQYPRQYPMAPVSY